MKKKISFYFLIFFILLAPAKISISGISSEEYPTRGIAEEVIDGDTIRLANGEMVRYLGINAPEVRRRKGDSWEYRPQLLAEEAMQLNTKLVQDKEVKLEYDTEKKDMYGRLLAYVYTGSLMVNEEILKQGYALIDIVFPNTKYAKSFTKKYLEAKNNNRGLWAAAKQEVISPQQAKNFVDKCKTIEGFIKHIEDKEGLVRLVFDDSGEKETAIIILKNNLPIFLKNKINPTEVYLGKKVRFAGFIYKHAGAYEVIITHPVEIEILQ